MMRFVLAAAAAFALAGAAPALACGDDCPMHKTASTTGNKVAAADKTAATSDTDCGCKDSKDCKCPAGKCECKACHPKKGEKKT